MNHEWATLAGKAQAGDRAAYGVLLTGILVPLRSYVARRVRQSDSREDVVQEILISIHKALPTYRPGEPFEPWMYSVARYRVVDHFRRRGRALQREDLRGDLSTGAEFTATETGTVASEDVPLGEDISAALGAIPERQRQAVLYLKRDDLSVRDAATRMGVSESSLKVLAHRGYKALRTLLTKGSSLSEDRSAHRRTRTER